MAKFGGQSQSRWGDNTLNTNEYIRDIMLTDLSGKPNSTADLRRRGAMLLLVFFDTTSAASRDLLLGLQKMADAYGALGKMGVLGISQHDEALTRPFVTELGVKFPVMMDRDLYHSLIYGLTAVPTLFFVDNNGVILRRFAGYYPQALNEISGEIAKFAEVEPVVIVSDSAPSKLLQAPKRTPV
ncbi:MAG: hypothetical protein OHK0029_32360 [Armatimonadaceae bacterium]